MSNYREINEDIDKMQEQKNVIGNCCGQPVYGPPPELRHPDLGPSEYIASIVEDIKAKQESKVETALRFNTGKPKLSYFRRSFTKALEAIARIKEFGAAKYDDDNWRKGGKPDNEYLDSMDRHLDAWLKGETYDQDSGCHHLGHAIWNLCALFELNYQKDPVINEELFHKQVKLWLEKRGKI